MTQVEQLLSKISKNEKRIDMNQEIIGCLIDIDYRLKQVEEINKINRVLEPNTYKKINSKKDKDTINLDLSDLAIFG